MAKRTRPGGGKQNQLKLEAEMPKGRTYPGCCTPFPYAVFENQTLTELYAQHRGRNCAGYREPMSVGAWNEEVDRRAAARSGDGGNDR